MPRRETRRLWGADGSQMLLFGCVSCMPLLPARSSLQQIFEGGQTTPHHSQGSDAQDSPIMLFVCTCPCASSESRISPLKSERIVHYHELSWAPYFGQFDGTRTPASCGGMRRRGWHTARRRDALNRPFDPRTQRAFLSSHASPQPWLLPMLTMAHRGRESRRGPGCMQFANCAPCSLSWCLSPPRRLWDFMATL